MTDALTDVLASVRMEGSVFSRAALSAPFGVESGQLPTGIFHAVVTGRPLAQLQDDSQAARLERGDVVVFPYGDNHLIRDSITSRHRPIGEMTTIDHNGMGQLVVDGGGDRTSLICGKIAFDSGEAHPVFSMLPRMIVVRDQDGRTQRIVESLIGLIAEEVDAHIPGTEAIVARLTDALVVYILRAYINQLEPGEGGWLGALQDPSVREAMGLIHRDPGHPWTVDELAEASGLSRSVFFARFKALVGETPGEYLTRWRIHVATRLLRQDRSVAHAGREVGYKTDAAFSNAFLRVMGVRPGAYRRAS